MGWMAWTTPTALFFVAIALLLAGQTVAGVVRPSSPRRGLLPMPTTRGDRLFVGLLGSAYVNLAWAGLSTSSQWFAVGISTIFTLAIGRWGLP
jgi:predicted small integral membrane protein